MKANYFLLFAALGLVLGVAGALFKIQHWPGADWLLLSSIVLDLVGVVGFAAKTLTDPQTKDFLNR